MYPWKKSFSSWSLRWSRVSFIFLEWKLFNVCLIVSMQTFIMQYPSSFFWCIRSHYYQSIIWWRLGPESQEDWLQKGGWVSHVFLGPPISCFEQFGIGTFYWYIATENCEACYKSFLLWSFLWKSQHISPLWAIMHLYGSKGAGYSNRWCSGSWVRQRHSISP